ncbi:MAG: AMP-binding protein, partial [Alphaproteobacteria bacterium]
MLDVAAILAQAAARSPEAEALVDGERRWTYRALLDAAERLAGGLGRLGLRPGDHVVSLCQNTAEAALLHWAAQIARLAITPLNWRATADEVDFCVGNAEAKALFYQEISAEAAMGAPSAAGIPRIGVGPEFEALLAGEPARSAPDVEATSVMLNTPGPTGRPKGVPRSHRAERAAALAHVAQNRYGRGERTLGVMPLYHTMGVRALLASALVDG